MTSALKFRVAACAMLAALGGAAGTAQAADLGGDCCADLEERIAELEATTARKGNRKVKLEVSGHVNEAIMFWDDGSESNAYVVTNDNARSRFRFKGEAKINEDWKAGYLLELGVRTANSKRSTQDDALGEGNRALDLRHSTWFLDSKKFGKVWVGLTGGASEGVTEVNQAATKDIAKYSDIEDSGLGLNLRINGVNNLSTSNGLPAEISWRRLIRGGGDQPGEGRRYNLVRYDTPEFFGFTATVNWGADDTWETGLKYKGEIGDFKLAAAIAYGENTNDSAEGFQCVGNNVNGTNPPVAGIPDTDCEQLGGSVSVMHAPTGIYVNFGAGYLKDNTIGIDPGAVAIRPFVDDRSEFYAGEVGIEQKWNALGKTTIFGQYYRNNGGSQDRNFGNGFAGNGDIVESELTSWGAGVIQGIDAAAMHVYLTYRHYEADVTTGASLTNFSVDDLDVVMAGAIIRF